MSAETIALIREEARRAHGAKDWERAAHLYALLAVAQERA